MQVQVCLVAEQDLVPQVHSYLPLVAFGSVQTSEPLEHKLYNGFDGVGVSAALPQLTSAAAIVHLLLY